MSLWPVVSKDNPCPICGKPDWCAIGDRAIKCMRVESDHPCESGGWYHPISGAASAPKLRPEVKRSPYMSLNWAKMINDWDANTDSNLTYVHANSLGVLATSLLALRACWASQYNAWAFPMRDARGEAIGIRLRAQDGRKWTVKDSRSGLFFDYLCTRDNEWTGERAYIVEGPTDTAAGLSIGLKIIGKPSAGACNEMVVELVKRLGVREAVILADRDEKKNPATGQLLNVGITEAKKLKAALSVKTLICPPPAGFKDLREFVKAGGNKLVLNSLIQNYTWK